MRLSILPLLLPGQPSCLPTQWTMLYSRDHGESARLPFLRLLRLLARTNSCAFCRLDSTSLELIFNFSAFRTVGRISVTNIVRYWFRGSGLLPNSFVSALLIDSISFSP